MPWVAGPAGRRAAHLSRCGQCIRQRAGTDYGSSLRRTTLLNTVAIWIDRRKPDLRHECGDTREMSAKERISQHHCRVRAIAADRLEGVIEVFHLLYF